MSKMMLGPKASMKTQMEIVDSIFDHLVEAAQRQKITEVSVDYDIREVFSFPAPGQLMGKTITIKMKA